VGSILFSSATLLGDAPAGGAPVGGGNPWSLIVTFLPILVLFYFLMWRPQRQEQSKRAKMLEVLKKNDRVVTVAGIYGVVTNVHREADEVTLKVDEATGTKIRVQLSAVSRVLGEEDPSSTASSTK
jgi:preprotein translocase subunit YajC